MLIFPLAREGRIGILLGMNAIYARRIAAWAFFIMGFSLMLLGLTFLLGFVAGVSRFPVFLSFLFLVAGSLFSTLAIKLNKRPSYIFFASFFFMVGFFVFFTALGIIPRFFFFRAWPLIAVFSGLALLPTGWCHYGAFRSNFVVPSCAFLLLGSTLLIFSFRLVTFSFKQFILNWWPLFIILAGIILVIGSLSAKNNNNNN